MSAAEQREYERKVPHVDITVELICGWFDDAFHPEDARFRSLFTADEWGALMKFHKVFDNARKDLPESGGTVETWLRDESWHKVMKAADDALLAFPSATRGTNSGSVPAV